jgi:hypothetical protein
MRDAAFQYSPRNPEEIVLYQVIAGQLETFLNRQQERDRPVPRFVEDEFRSFLDCGILARGFLRLRCQSCGHDRLLPYSCKGRAWCPSCGGRRMADVAAHLVDRVFPIVPVRQWVLSLPFALRYRMAYDARLTGDVLNVFIRALFGELRRRAQELLGLGSSQCGAVTFVQRFGDALNANPHFHCIGMDGVYIAGDDGHPQFHELPAPEDEDVLRLTTLVSKRVESLLQRRALGSDADSPQADPLFENDPGMAALLASSVRRRIAVGSNAGRSVVRLGDQIDGDSMDTFQGPRCAMVSGFSVHANVSVEAHDRIRLERLIRYAARPAVATERLSELPDGRLLYRLKRPWRDGTSTVIFEPQDFMAKLAVLVPAPRAHLTRYHGVLGPAAALRPLIIPTTTTTQESSDTLNPPSQRSTAPDVDAEPVPEAPPPTRHRNYTWAELMKRVFLVDVLQCERCGGTMKILAAIQPPEVTARILECLGLPTRAPPLTPAFSHFNSQMDSF